MDERTLARFWSKVDRRGDSECWLWTAFLWKGYGWFSVAPRKQRHAHRLSYEIANGPVPGNLFVCHHCDNRACVNPRHLFLGTNADNMRDMAEKARRKGRGGTKGSTHNLAKLSDADVIAIRAARGTQCAIAAQYGVSQSLVSLIRSGKLWAHI